MQTISTDEALREAQASCVKYRLSGEVDPSPWVDLFCNSVGEVTRHPSVNSTAYLHGVASKLSMLRTTQGDPASIAFYDAVIERLQQMGQPFPS